MSRIFFVTNRRARRNEFGPSTDIPQNGFDDITAGTAIAAGSAFPGTAGDYGGIEQASARNESELQSFIGEFLREARTAGAIPCVIVHGFNFTFPEAVVRVADVAACYASGNEARPVALAPLLVSWPSHGDMFGYDEDKASAMASANSIGLVFLAIQEAVRQARVNRLMLLAHSMGAFALGSALQAMARGGPGVFQRAFAQAIVVAGDVDRNAFAVDGPLRSLSTLADYVTIGINRQDATTTLLARMMGEGPALAAYGPADASDLPANVCIVDYSMACAMVFDQPVPSNDSTWNYVAHNYYRTNPRVRADIAQIFGNAAPEAIAGRARSEDVADAAPGRLYVLPPLPQLQVLAGLAERYNAFS